MARILEVFGEPFSNGGQEAFIMNVLQNIDVTDLNIDFYTPYYCDNNYYKSIIEEKGGKVFEAGLKFNPGASRLNIIKPLKHLLKKQKYDVVHIHSGSISCLAYSAFAAYICGVKKIIVHSHATGEKKNLKYHLAKFVTAPIMNLCPTDYYACSDLAGEWKFSKNVCRNKLHIVNNGIDLKKFTFNDETRKLVRKQLCIKDDCFLIGHVGRFSAEKNHHFLLDVFNEIYKKNPKAVLLLIGNGELEDEMKAKAEQLGLKDNVIFYGNSNKANELYQAMDCFVFPSNFEGLGIVAIEAQAAGLKTFCSDAVPDEAKITNLFEYMSLSDSAEKWADKILNTSKKYERKNMSEVIRKKGYDIVNTSSFLKKSYLSEK